MLNQKVSCWICYIDDKQSRKGGWEGEWRQPPFHFRKEKVSGNKVCVKEALYSNKTSHKTYLSEGRSTFAVWTVVYKLTNQSIGVHIYSNRVNNTGIGIKRHGKFRVSAQYVPSLLHRRLDFQMLEEIRLLSLGSDGTKRRLGEPDSPTNTTVRPDDYFYSLKFFLTETETNASRRSAPY